MNTIHIIGIGPGKKEYMTLEALHALEQSDLIIGYHVYVDLVKPIFPEKEYLTTPMKKEADRCKLCFEEAAKGKSVALVCSGDAGVYGMAGLMEYFGQDYPDITIRTVCGVTAALSGAGVLGAPLIQDFAIISLSDLLTPWETIEKRLLAAAGADMVICLYNPSSKNRPDYLRKACELILTHAAPDTVCGYVENIGRDGENSHICTLTELKETAVNMFTTVFIGNSQTKRINGKMVTPRGYRLE